jgi:hypothetical protein
MFSKIKKLIKLKREIKRLKNNNRVDLEFTANEHWNNLVKIYSLENENKKLRRDLSSIKNGNVTINRNPCKEHIDVDGDICPICLYEENERLKKYITLLVTSGAISRGKYAEVLGIDRCFVDDEIKRITEDD